MTNIQNHFFLNKIIFQIFFLFFDLNQSYQDEKTFMEKLKT